MINNNSLLEEDQLYGLSINHRYIVIAGKKYNFELKYLDKDLDYDNVNYAEFGIWDVEETLVSIKNIEGIFYVNPVTNDFDLTINVLNKLEKNLTLLDTYRIKYKNDKECEVKLSLALTDLIRENIEIIKTKHSYTNGKTNYDFVMLNHCIFDNVSNHFLNNEISQFAILSEIHNPEIRVFVFEVKFYVVTNMYEKTLETILEVKELEALLKEVMSLHKLNKRLFIKRKIQYGK